MQGKIFQECLGDVKLSFGAVKKFDDSVYRSDASSKRSFCKTLDFEPALLARGNISEQGSRENLKDRMRRRSWTQVDADDSRITAETENRSYPRRSIEG